MRAHRLRLLQYPQVKVLEMRDFPGTTYDSANLRLGKIIRRNSIRTMVPANGPVRSGAIELFLAGVERSASDSARFVIHAWQTDQPQLRSSKALSSAMFDIYTRYYREMGMSNRDAVGFYKQTMAMPEGRGLSLKRSDLERSVAIRSSGVLTG